MERTKWTDNKLDERFATMDEKFDLLFRELSRIREEMRAGFAGLRQEMAADRAEVIAFHRQALYVSVTLWLGLLGLIASQL